MKSDEWHVKQTKDLVHQEMSNLTRDILMGKDTLKGKLFSELSDLYTGKGSSQLRLTLYH